MLNFLTIINLKIMIKTLVPDVVEETTGNENKMLSPIKRGTFLKYLGASAAFTALTLAGCKKSDDPTPGSVTFTSDDFGVLNYAYALEQLEAAFYIQVVATPYSGIPATELTLLTSIRDHEKLHRDFFKNAITALKGTPIMDLTPDFSSIDFTSRASVLGAAKAFEDLGVSAYNGAGHGIKTADYLVLAGKIVSVEARHAAAIRDLMNPNSADFAGDDVVDATSGLDGAKNPVAVLAIAQKYVKNKFDSSGLSFIK